MTALTDGQGRTVDFQQTLIILTSNPIQALSQLPEGSDSGGRQVMSWMRCGTLPARVPQSDETVIFDRLARGDMDGIVTIQMSRLLKRSRKINLALTTVRVNGH
jgi:ATP-dependent Clp protease ATP-binding subunit ClpB